MRLDWRHRSPFALDEGSHIGGHEIRRLVGLRGAGELVYDAQSPDGSDVSIVVSTAAPGQRQDRARFRRLVPLRTAADHPGLLPVRGHGRHAGAPFLITDPYPPETLADLLEGEPIAAKTLLPMMASAAEALDLCNSLGMIHHNLTAESLLLDGDRLVLDGVGLAAPSLDLVWGSSMRDFRYATPEEMSGAPLGPAGNVYSLAAVLVHALTGSPPYDGSQASLAYAQLSQSPPRPSERVPALAPAIDDVIAWGMDKDPSRRPPSATALLYAAAEALSVAMPPSHDSVPLHDSVRSDDSVRFDDSVPFDDSVASRAADRAWDGIRVRIGSLARDGIRVWDGIRVRVGSRARERIGPVGVSRPGWVTLALASAVALICVAAVCGFVAGSLADPFGGDAQPASERPDARLIARVDERRGDLRAQLAEARLPQEQSAAASELASTYDAAARRATSPALAAAARATGGSYAELADAADAGSAARFEEASRAVTRAENQLAAVAARTANLQADRK